MNIFKRIGLTLRMARRLGAFKRAIKGGMSIEQARSYSDSLYPPTTAESAYEENLRREQLRDEIFATARRLASDDKVDLSSLSTDQQMLYVDRAAVALGVRLTSN